MFESPDTNSYFVQAVLKVKPEYLNLFIEKCKAKYKVKPYLSKEDIEQVELEIERLSRSLFFYLKFSVNA